MTEPELNKTRGLALANRPGSVVRVSSDTWLVTSENRVRTYRVQNLNGRWKCERDGDQKASKPCRHIEAAQIDESRNQQDADSIGATTRNEEEPLHESHVGDAELVASTGTLPKGDGQPQSLVSVISSSPQPIRSRQRKSKTEEALQKRVEKGYELFRLGLVEEAADGSFYVASQMKQEEVIEFNDLYMRARKGDVSPKESERLVKLQTKKGRRYHVIPYTERSSRFRWLCQCEDTYWWSGPCKHVIAISYYLHEKHKLALPLWTPEPESPLQVASSKVPAKPAMMQKSDQPVGTQAQTEAAHDPLPEAGPEAAVEKGDTKPTCRKCGSPMSHNGHAIDGTPLYSCEAVRVDGTGATTSCGTFHRKQSLLKGSRYDIEMVAAAFEQYFEHDDTLRKARNYLLLNRGYKGRPSTISKWFERYIPIIYDYILTLTPGVSDTWHMDEVDIRLRGGFKRKSKKGGYHGYGFGVRCPVTKYLCAFEGIATKEARDVEFVLREATKATKKTPAVIVSDDAGSFPTAIDMAYIDKPRKPLHVVARSGVAQKNGNQPAERLNNTFRERHNQRGFKSLDTPLLKGFLISYNFVRPHMSLGNSPEDTPARAAGLNVVSGKDKWLQLLILALKHQRDSQPTQSSKGGSSS